MKTKNLFLATMLVAFGVINENIAQTLTYSEPVGSVGSAGFYNTYLGYGAGSNFGLGQPWTNNSSNVAVGMNAGRLLESSGNCFLGWGSGAKTTIGGNNVFMGASSGSNNTTGSGNVFIGTQAGILNVSGFLNTFLGSQAGNENQNGSYNTFLGNGAGHANISGQYNTTVGVTSGGNLISGNYNSFLGHSSGINVTTGLRNVCIGTLSGEGLTTGNANSFIGYVKVSDPDIQNSIILADGDYNQRFYIHNNGYAGIGLGNNVIPKNRLEITAGFTPSGLRMKNLPNTEATLTSPNPSNRVLSVDVNGDVILVDDKQGTGSGTATTNILASNTNTMISTVNGIAANAPIINTVVNTIASGQLTTTVNGVSSNPISLSTLTEVDGDVTNELQNLGLSGNVLSISNGNSVTLPTYADTDAQTLSITGNQLTISNGNTITLPTSGGGTGTNTNIYTNDGTIDVLTTTTALNLRTVDMANTNLFFNTANSSYTSGTRGFGRIYIGNSVNLPILSTATATNLSRYRLLVEGGVLTEKVKVALSTTANWADYVFAKDYKLMPLNEVETYVKANKHLPGVSSAEKLVNEGLDLGEMLAKQMEKIEELTLYIIEMNKKLESQAKEIQELKSKSK